jgi:glutamate carboxypeptidase
MRDLTPLALLDVVRGWVEIERPTQDVTGVNRMADHVESLLRRLGAHIERRPGTDSFGDILIGRIAGAVEGPGLLLLGHIDTVHPTGTLAAALRFRVEGDRAYGPGIYDMKGGNAIALAALAHLHATGRKPLLPVTVMMIPDEEVGSPSSRSLIEAEALKHRAVLVPEPSGEGGKLTVARHGIARWHIRTLGRSAHAGAYHAEGPRSDRPSGRAAVRRTPGRCPPSGAWACREGGPARPGSLRPGRLGSWLSDASRAPLACGCRRRSGYGSGGRRIARPT